MDVPSVCGKTELVEPVVVVVVVDEAEEEVVDEVEEEVVDEVVVVVDAVEEEGETLANLITKTRFQKEHSSM
jgi:hypoxanthine-guanine phosphoribosyltransferase